MAKAPQRPELDWFRGRSMRKKPASTREIDAIARSDRFEKDSSAYSRSEMDSFYGSQLTGKTGPKFEPDPVRKGKLNLSYDPSPKKFGDAVADYARKNPNRDGGVEDRRGQKYSPDSMFDTAFTRDLVNEVDKVDRNKEGRGRGRENMDINSPQQNNSEWFKGGMGEDDVGPAGLKSNQSRKASPEEAIDKTFNRR